MLPRRAIRLHFVLVITVFAAWLYAARALAFVRETVPGRTAGQLLDRWIMNKEQVLGIVRHILTFGGGIVVGKGWFDEATMTAIVGAVVTVVGALWSVWAPEKKAA
jgi:hypothetical protein